jgi:hypothetical protein
MPGGLPVFCALAELEDRLHIEVVRLAPFRKSDAFVPAVGQFGRPRTRDECRHACGMGEGRVVARVVDSKALSRPACSAARWARRASSLHSSSRQGGHTLSTGALTWRPLRAATSRAVSSSSAIAESTSSPGTRRRSMVPYGPAANSGGGWPLISAASVGSGLMPWSGMPAWVARPCIRMDAQISPRLPSWGRSAPAPTHWTPPDSGSVLGPWNARPGQPRSVPGTEGGPRS